MLDETYPARFHAPCDEAQRRKWKRIILLGDDAREGPYSLKACLAQSGVMVFVPGPQDRSWLQGLSALMREGASPDAASLERMKALLADGMEHGVDALIVTDPALLTLARSLALGTQLLDATEV